MGERDTLQLADAGAAVRALREHGTRTGLVVLPGRGHDDVLAVREEILAGAGRFHGAPGDGPGVGPGGAPGEKTVTWHP